MLSLPIKLSLLVVGLGGAYALTKAAEPTPKRKTIPVSSLSGVYVPGAAVGAMDEDILQSIVLPIQLYPALVSRLYARTPQADIIDVYEKEPMGIVVDDLETLSTLVTNVSSEAASAAYDLMVHKAPDTNITDPEQVARAVQEVLGVVAPKVVWTTGLQGTMSVDAKQQVWDGIELIGVIAFQSYWNVNA